MKRERTITQMREKGKTQENELSDEKILGIQEKDFVDDKDDARHWK